MDIWLLSIGEPISKKDNVRKLRTTILAEKLLGRGHTVVLWASTFGHFKKEWIFKKDTEIKLKNGLIIKAIKGIGYKKNISLSRFIDHRIVAWKFKKLSHKMSKPDIIVASMPSHDLAYEAVTFAKKSKIPVLVDIRDTWPDIFLNHIPEIFRGLIKMVLYKDFKMIKTTLEDANGLIAATNSFLEWGLKYVKREKNCWDKIFYLGCEKLGQQNISSKSINLIDKLKNKFIVTFIGTFAHYHNPSILIDCAMRLSNTNIQFVLAGDGEFFNGIQERAALLNNVILTGWLEQEEISALLRCSHVGICPTVREIDLFPNKVFTYLSAGLPIISAFQGDLKEIIEKYEIGFYYPPNDVDALVSCVKKLYNDPILFKKMSESVFKVFDEMCDANKIYEKYADHVEKVINEYKKMFK